MRAKRTHKQNLRRQQLQDIKVVASKINSKESLASLVAKTGIYYQVYDNMSEDAYEGSKPIIDKSLSKRLGLRRSLLRGGKPFEKLPVMIRETGRTHKRFIEDDDATLVKSKSSFKRQSGPVKQIMKDGKVVEDGNK